MFALVSYVLSNNWYVSSAKRHKSNQKINRAYVAHVMKIFIADNCILPSIIMFVIGLVS
jgi:hypothetical protein